jgi:hypothetical protein
MTADPILTLAWLVLAHLVADFIVQTGKVVRAKTSPGSSGLQGIAVHAAGVALCLVPVGLAFGASGWWVLVAITLSHVGIDRTKIVLSRRAERRALARAQRRHEGQAPAAGLGRAWTPLPAAYFALDQAAHLVVLGVAWAIWIEGQAPSAEWASAIATLVGARDAAALHDVVMTSVVLVSLVIVNVRAGAIFVATLVRPIEAATELAESSTAPTTDGVVAIERAARGPAGWSIRVGPIVGRVTADPAPTREDGDVVGERVALPPPAQVGGTIGVLERLLIVTFMLAGADAAIGFVVGAKTLARFRLLDDRDFAEYYLLGTLASVAVAILSAIIARAALQA